MNASDVNLTLSSWECLCHCESTGDCCIERTVRITSVHHSNHGPVELSPWERTQRQFRSDTRSAAPCTGEKSRRLSSRQPPYWIRKNGGGLEKVWSEDAGEGGVGMIQFDWSAAAEFSRFIASLQIVCFTCFAVERRLSFVCWSNDPIWGRGRYLGRCWWLRIWWELHSWWILPHFQRKPIGSGKGAKKNSADSPPYASIPLICLVSFCRFIMGNCPRLGHNNSRSDAVVWRTNLWKQLSFGHIYRGSETFEQERSGELGSVAESIGFSQKRLSASWQASMRGTLVYRPGSFN